MTEERHSAYCDATALLADLAPELDAAEQELLSGALDDLFVSDNQSGALAAFTDADLQIAELSETGRVAPRTARRLLEAFATAGPEMLVAA